MKDLQGLGGSSQTGFKEVKVDSLSHASEPKQSVLGSITSEN